MGRAPGFGLLLMALAVLVRLALAVVTFGRRLAGTPAGHRLGEPVTAEQLAEQLGAAR